MSNMIPRYDTKLFCEIWEDSASFKTDFQASPFAGCIHYGEAKPSPETGNYNDDVTLLFYLLYGRYANNPIANMDVNQWKMKMFSIVFQYGPTWEKRLDIQDRLRGLSEAEILQGGKAIYNSALNPSDAPSTASLEELQFINGQNTTNYKKSKMEGYAILWELLKTDVTGEFLSKFQKCFKQFVQPERTFIYVSEEDEDND